MNKEVILTGIRANNDLHIGNYFGALRPVVDMANNLSENQQINLFVPDLHSITTPIDYTELQDQIKSSLKIFVAAGLPLDSENILLYRQSRIPAHSELTWILDCFTGFGEMSRMTQFKNRSAGFGSDRVSVGVFNYPVLMASDILLYGAKYVPVGDDQTQHLEFTRDLAQRINSQFGELFIVPAPVEQQHKFFGKDQGLRIRDLIDPTKKMSKSDNGGKGIIFLNDDPEDAAKKIMSATTDSLGTSISDIDPTVQPGLYNLLTIQGLLSDYQAKVAAEGTEGYEFLKKTVAAAVKNFLRKFQDDLAKVDETRLMQKLESDEKTMAEIADKTLLKVQKAVGLR